MYVEGTRLRPCVYRFLLPEEVETDSILFLMSGVHAALTPRDYKITAESGIVDIELVRDVPAAGGTISLYAFFIPPPRRKNPPPKKA